MDNVSETHAPAATAAKGDDGQPTAPHEIVVHAPAALAAPAEEIPLVTLDDYCAEKSKKLRQVELIAAFGKLERAKHHLLDTVANYDADFDALRKRPA